MPTPRSRRRTAVPLAFVCALALIGAAVFRRSGLVRPPAPAPVPRPSPAALLGAWTFPGSRPTGPDTRGPRGAYVRELETESPVQQVFLYYAARTGTAGRPPSPRGRPAATGNAAHTADNVSRTDRAAAVMDFRQRMPGYVLSGHVVHARAARTTRIRLTLAPRGPAVVAP